MRTKVSVAFDVDPLGLGYYNPHEQTGVYRVVENMAEGLEEKFRIYQINLPQESKDVSFQINSWIKKRIRKILAGYYQGKGSYRLLTNLYRMLPFKVNQLIPSNVSAYRSLDGILTQANVYHSPYSKITDHVNSFAHLKHFITIHNLIPILYPAYNTKNSLRRIWTATAGSYAVRCSRDCLQCLIFTRNCGRCRNTGQS